MEDGCLSHRADENLLHLTAPLGRTKPPNEVVAADSHPPHILLIRGRAELDVVDGIPDEFLEMNGRYTMTPVRQRVAWERQRA
jgi:hypothetical protein